MTSTPDSPRAVATSEFLTRSVRIATGNPDAAPRPGQQLMVDDMVSSADPLGGHVAGVAPTGSGKSLAAYAVSGVGACKYDERWVISTESLSLQAQYLEKDAPVVQRAARELYGRDLKIAALKGWSNYACMMKAQNTLREAGMRSVLDVEDRAKIPNLIRRFQTKDTVHADGRQHDSSKLKELLAWVVEQHEDESCHGDKSSYQGTVTDDEWASVSVSTQECLGENACPLATICRARIARDKAADADIVVTNHAMLAVQAASNAPVVIGNAKLGPFQGIIVDEAHALPGIVRSQGQSAISGRRLNATIRAVRAAAKSHDPNVTKWVEDGRKIIEAAQVEIAQTSEGKLVEGDDPLEHTGDLITLWLKTGSKLANTNSTELSHVIASKRAQAGIEKLLGDVDRVREHRFGVARWAEPASRDLDPQARMSQNSVQSAPVQVGKLLERTLWVDSSSVVLPAAGEEVPVSTPGEDDEFNPGRPLTVICLSATLPAGFVRDAGLHTQARSYPSPFDAAYANSRLLIPRVVDPADITAVSVERGGQRRFDVARHAEWAAAGMARLADANQGSSIVLSATVGNGKLYAARLREAARGRWKVYSQWDGEPASVIVHRWRADESSILVGTKSMMTGVDAPGNTNTLVMIDRAPRSASNPVDDARVEVLAEALGGDKYAADRFVYVADAAALLEQALGRLIRSTSDSGLAVIFDPRMINAGPFKYPEPSRKIYQKSMERFTNKTADIDDAEQWLREHRRTR